MIVVGTWRYDEENGVDSGRVRVFLIDESQSDWIQTGINILDPTPSTPATINAGPIVTFTPIHHGGVDDKQSSGSDREAEQMPPSRWFPIISNDDDVEVVCDASSSADTRDHNARGLTKTIQKYRVIIILGLILVMTVAIAVVVFVAGRDRGLTNAPALLAIATSPSESPTVGPAMILPTLPPAIITWPLPSTVFNSKIILPTTPSSVTSALSASLTTTIPTKTTPIWKQQGQAIFGDSTDNKLGSSVALSADARTIAIRAPGNYLLDSERGYVKVYRTIGNDGEDRVQLGQTICEDAPGDQFGQSVDIAADGNTLVIGSSGHWEDND